MNKISLQSSRRRAFRPWRHVASLTMATILASSGIVVAVDSVAGAITSLSGITFTSNSYVSANTTATWTVGFTTSASGQLVSGNAVDVAFPGGSPGFNVTGATAAYGIGFSGCSTPPTVVINGQYVIIPLSSGCSLAANTAATVTITGLNPGATQYSNSGFSVNTYPDSTFVHPSIDGSSTLTSPVINILATVTYSTLTSQGTPTSSGTPPIDASSPYSTVSSSTVTVLANSNLALAGYTFAGWCTTKTAGNPTLCTGTTYAATNTFTIAANTTLYSMWTLATSADGSGTTIVSPISATGAFPDASTYTFTYTAASGGMNSGEVDIAVPSGWTTPSASATAGCTTILGGGTLGFVGQSIDVSALSLAGGATLTVTYGATSGGSCVAGDGALPRGGTSTFTTTEKSTAGGTLTPIFSSPFAMVTLTCPSNLTGTNCDVPVAATLHFCGPGQYLNGASCSSCPEGTFTATSNRGANCNSAPAGTYVSFIGATSATPCDAGSYSSMAGSSSCLAVPAGSYSSAGAVSSTLCPAGSFSAHLGSPTCTLAPPGSYAIGMGAGLTGATSAALCAIGSFSSSSGSAACAEAPAGTYVDTVGASSDTPCPTGTTTVTGVLGATSGSLCSVTSPLFKSANSLSVTVEIAFHFAVNATGSPLPTMSVSGRLPAGVSFRNDNAGSATLSGRPAAGTGGEYALTIKMKNSFGSTTQSFTLLVRAQPTFKSAASVTTEAAGPPGVAVAPLNFEVKTSGYPSASITKTGSLPKGVSFVDNGDGTATLKGTPAVDSGGQYPITFLTQNSVGTTSQAFTLTVPSIDVYALNTGALCIGDGTTTLLYCPDSGIPNLSIRYVCNAKQCGDKQLADSYCPKGTQSQLASTAGQTGVVTCAVPANQVTAGSVDKVVLDFSQGGKSQAGPSLHWLARGAVPILTPVITSLDSTTCSGRTLSGAVAVGVTDCPSVGSSIVVNGKNFFYTTTLTPGLCSSTFYITFFQLLCLLAPQPPGTVTNVQAFTPGMGQSTSTDFSVTTMPVPVITSLQDIACTGTNNGLALTGCPSVGGSTLVVKVNGTALATATVTRGLCSNVIRVDSNTLACTVSLGIAPGTTENVTLTEGGSTSTTAATISF